MEKIDISKDIDSERPKRYKFCYVMGLIGLGQVTCITFSSFGVFNKILDDNGLSIPATTVFLTYLMFLSLGLCECGKMPREVKPHQFYLFLCALLDTASFTLNMFAYQYTTIANNDLMQVFGIFVAAFLSMIVLKLKYHGLHYLGMLLGAVGMLATVWNDLFNPDQSYSSSYLLGDLFAILSSACYATEIVIQEKLLSQGIPPFAYIANIAKYSVILSVVIFCATLQFKVYNEFTGNWLYLLYELPLLVISFVNTIAVVFFINYYGATAYTIIALCGVLYSMLYDVFLFSSPFRYLVIIGYAIIVISVVIFHIKEPYKPQDKHRQLMETNIEDLRAPPSTQRQLDE